MATLKEIDYGLIGDKLPKLLIATSNKLEREWPENRYPVDSARVVFVMLVRSVVNTFNSIMYLCADIPNDWDRQPIYRVSLPPLTRTIYETLISLIFLLEDIPAHVALLFKSGYYDKRRELEHCQKYYGTSPEWTAYITTLEAAIKDEEKRYRLSATEIQNPKQQIGLWPTPGAALNKIKAKNPSSPVIPFIELLNSWLYRELSGLTHTGLSNLIEFGWLFSREQAELRFGDQYSEKVDEHLLHIRNIQLHTVITLLLAIASEIEGHFSFDLQDRIKELWTLMVEAGDTSAEIYEARYKALLQ